MAIWRFLLKRLVYLVFQVLGVVTITFFLVRLLPGNPANALAGVGAREETIAAIEKQLGLGEPLPVQYGIYIRNLARGELGDSVFTGQSVSSDLAARMPATLELVILSMIIAVVVGIPLGIYVALRRKGIGQKIFSTYGMLTGAIPDFWLGLILIFVFFSVLGVAPAPLGRLGVDVRPPPDISGFYILDSILAWDLQALRTTLAQLTLPVLTLVLVYMGNITKMARSTMQETSQSDFIEHAEASGLTPRMILRYNLRNALAPVVTVVAFTSGFLLGGAVLVETVFSWGGMGQYAVEAITNSDFAPITGFVLVVSLFMALIYLVLDLVYAAIDPRIKH